ncbi:MAG: hypothetical protein F6J93_14350 [Oscillatoria sp. SIO1A7]|nr:hypothetical protein [Oscillatoria sp. SIO1A7]
MIIYIGNWELGIHSGQRSAVSGQAQSSRAAEQRSLSWALGMGHWRVLSLRVLSLRVLS